MKIITLLLTLLLFSQAYMSCKKKDPVPESGETKRLVSVKLVSEISIKDLKIFADSYGLSELHRQIKYAVEVYRVVYKTTFKEKSIEASGLLFVPKGIQEPAPLLSAQHGTLFKKSDAPSVSFSFSGVELFTSSGYITLMPDYIGYGASAEIFHPYYDEHHSGLAVADMLRAVKEYLDEKEIKYNGKLFLSGYSEGGYVTLAAQKSLEENPVSGFTLAGVASGSGGYDLPGMLHHISIAAYYPFPAYLVFIIHSYNSVYDWNKLWDYFLSPQYAAKINDLTDGSHEGTYINNQLTTNMEELFNEEFFSHLKGSGELQLKKALVRNSMTSWKPQTPLRLYHGTHDELIPFENTKQTYEKLKEHGAQNIEFIPIPNGTHSTTFVPMIKSFYPWFEEKRF